jgi:hypothetical protein
VPSPKDNRKCPISFFFSFFFFFFFSFFFFADATSRPQIFTDFNEICFYRFEIYLARCEKSPNFDFCVTTGAEVPEMENGGDLAETTQGLDHFMFYKNRCNFRSL